MGHLLRETKMSMNWDFFRARHVPKYVRERSIRENIAAAEGRGGAGGKRDGTDEQHGMRQIASSLSCYHTWSTPVSKRPLPAAATRT